MAIISREEAIDIARSRLKQPAPRDEYQCFELKPARLSLYLTPTEPCWYIYVPWEDGLDGAMLRSTRVIVVGKRSGKVLYDGGASDEG